LKNIQDNDEYVHYENKANQLMAGLKRIAGEESFR
jgi:hypothetical protein